MVAVAAIESIPNYLLFRIFRNCVDLAVLLNREKEKEIQRHK